MPWGRGGAGNILQAQEDIKRAAEVNYLHNTIVRFGS